MGKSGHVLPVLHEARHVGFLLVRPEAIYKACIYRI
jgi:hypothetical protein